MRCYRPNQDTVANNNVEEVPLMMNNDGEDLSNENAQEEQPELTHAQKVSKINTYISYAAAHLICSSSLPYTAAERLLKPGFKAMLSAFKAYDVAIEDIDDIDDFVDHLPLSDTTIGHRVSELGPYLELKTVEAIKNSSIGFSLQADESLDIENKSQLSVYVRFVQFLYKLL